MAGDYERLWTEYEAVRNELAKERERSAEFERAARHARRQIGSIKVVK